MLEEVPFEDVPFEVNWAEDQSSEDSPLEDVSAEDQNTEGVPPEVGSSGSKAARPTLVDYATLKNHNKDSRKLFSSRTPNQALLWALIDDRKVESVSDKDSDHKLAVSYMEGWRPGPWKGQIWSPQSRDVSRVWVRHSMPLIWSGHDWMPYTGLEVVDRPFTYPEPSRASVRIVKMDEYSTAKVRKKLTEQELNDCCVAYGEDPSEVDNLIDALYAYINLSFIPKQIDKLLNVKHEIGTTKDDIVADFVMYMFSMLPEYIHQGKMQNWVTRSWKKYFFCKQQEEVITYTNQTRWMNELPNGEDYRHLDYCVSLLKAEADSDEWYKVSEGDRLSREMLTSDPKSPWFQLSASSREMLQARLNGESNKQIAARLKYTPQHVGRLVHAAIDEAKQINSRGLIDEGGRGWN